jgi:hypothetical protein
MRGLFYITILSILFSCVQQLEWTGDDNSGATLVVEGLVTTEPGPHYVLLSLTNPVITKNKRMPVEGAIVFISSGEDSWPLIEVESGKYESGPDLKGEPGKTYQINIIWNGMMIIGDDTMVPMKEVQSMPVEEENEIPGLEGFHKFTLRNSFSTDNPYKYQLEYQKPENISDHYPPGWEVPEWYLNSLDRYGRPVNDTTYYVVPGPEPPALLSNGELIYTGIAKGTGIQETFYSMSDAHYEFVRAMLLETEWKGVSPISGKPSNVPTNLSGDMPVVGFFAASDVRKIIQVVE